MHLTHLRLSVSKKKIVPRESHVSPTWQTPEFQVATQNTSSGKDQDPPPQEFKTHHLDTCGIHMDQWGAATSLWPCHVTLHLSMNSNGHRPNHPQTQSQTTLSQAQEAFGKMSHIKGWRTKKDQPPQEDLHLLVQASHSHSSPICLIFLASKLPQSTRHMYMRMKTNTKTKWQNFGLATQRLKEMHVKYMNDVKLCILFKSEILFIKLFTV